MGSDQSAALPLGSTEPTTKRQTPGTPKGKTIAGALKVTTASMSPQMLSLYQRVAINSKHRMSPSYSSSAGSGGRMRRRSMSTGSVQTEGEWGHFEDVGEPPTPTYSDAPGASMDDSDFGMADSSGRGGAGVGGGGGGGGGSERRSLTRALSLPQSASTPPMYVLESTLATQQLWYMTAGRRPKQPAREREYFEQLWKENFEHSSVKYPEVATAATATATAAPGAQPAAPSSSSGSGTTNAATAPGPADGASAPARLAKAPVSEEALFPFCPEMFFFLTPKPPNPLPGARGGAVQGVRRRHSLPRQGAVLEFGVQKLPRRRRAGGCLPRLEMRLMCGGALTSRRTNPLRGQQRAGHDLAGPSVSQGPLPRHYLVTTLYLVPNNSNLSAISFTVN